MKLRTWSNGFPLYICAAVAFSIVCSNGTAQAQEPDDDWHFASSFGIWAMAAKGNVGVRNVESDVDATFSDILDKAQVALNPGLQLSKGDWSIALTGMYAVLEDEQTFRNGRGGVITSTMGIADLSLGYTLLRTKLGEMPLAITPMIGVRYTYLGLDLNPNNSDTVSRNREWFDPYFGGRVVLGLTDALDWRTEGTYGGFSVGSDSTWSAGTYLDWKFYKNVSLNVGYRALSWDYDNDNLKWDITFHGPWIGLTTSWF